MTMVVVDFHSLAIAEARAARRRYARVSHALAARFMAALDAAVAVVEANPAGHPPYEYGTRVCRLKRFPHRLVFLELAPDRVLAVAVAHPSR